MAQLPAPAGCKRALGAGPPACCTGALRRECKARSLLAQLVRPHHAPSPRSPPRKRTLLQVLTDYEALPRVFHNIESSAVRTCGATGATQLVQTCKWAFLVFRCAARVLLLLLAGGIPGCGLRPHSAG